MAKPRVENETPLFYCATCGSFGTDERGYPIGTAFECPNDKTHFAAVVKPSAGMFWLRVERRIWAMQRFSPMHLFRGGGKAGLYHLCRVLVLVFAVFIATPNRIWIVRYAAIVIGLYFLFDILLLSTYATFVSRFPAHPLRSLILNLSAFFQVAVAYAILYRVVEYAFNRHLSTADAIYFSVVTIGTVGYGDVRVLETSPLAKTVEVVIVSEIIFGFYMLAGLVAVVASWANERPSIQTAKSLSELRGQSSRGERA